MPYATVSISTITNSTTTTINSSAVNLNWIGGKPSTVSLTFTTSLSSNTAQIQYTLDDIMRTSSPVWLSVASTAASSTIAVYPSSTWFDAGVTLSFLNPVAAVRFVSTNFSSGTITMKVLQGEGW